MTIVNNQIKAITNKELDTTILQNSFHEIVATTIIPKESIMIYANVAMEQGFINQMPEEDLFY